MKKIDFKHAAFHVLVGVYFLWVAVFTVLISMSISNSISNINPQLGGLFSLWTLFNLFMGTVLFVVIRLFRKKGMLSKIIATSYIFILIAGIVSLFLAKA